MASLAEPQPASLPLPGGRPGASVRLHPLLTGSTIGPDAWFHRVDGRLGALRALGVGTPKRDWLRVPVQAFLVEHPRAGRLLIDTGFHPSVAVDPKQNLGRIGTLVFRGIEMEAPQAAPAQLRARGVDAASVRYVLMTHFHIDHASAMSEFPDATFAFSAREWEAANEQGELHGYRQRQWDHGFDYRTLDFEGEDADSFATFGRSLDLLGDGSIRAVFTPGHTLGHVSYVLRLQAGEALVAGDAIYSRRTLAEGVLPYRVEDEHLFRRSLREIQLYARETPQAVVIPGHDMEALRAVGPLVS